MSTHSPISPSGAAVWASPTGCPGSVRMTRDVPDTTNDAALWGLDCHEVSEHLLRGAERRVGSVGTHGQLITEEMLDIAKLYAADVMAVYKRSPGELRVEERVACPTIHPESYGTPDAVIYCPASRSLHIWDLKTGRSLVEVYKNLQMINYAAGLYDKFPQALHIVLHIVQPRAYHAQGACRSWATTPEALAPMWAQLRDAALEAMSDDAMIRSGSHCRYCVVRGSCPAALSAAMAAIDCVEDQRLETPGPDALAYELRELRRAGEAITFRLTAAEAMARESIKRGETVPGFRVEQSRGNEAWRDDGAQVLEMGRLLGVDLSKPSAPVTPTQAKKILDPSIVSQFTERKMKAVKLVADDGSKAAAVFNTNI